MARNTRGKPKRDSAPAPQTPGDGVPFGRYPSPIPYFDEVLAAEWRLFERDGAGPVDPATLEPAVLRLRIVEHVRPVVERVLANPFVLRAVGYLRGPRPTLFPADVRRGWPSVLAAVLFLHSVDDAGRRAFAPDDPFARDGREAIEEALEREFARGPAKAAMNVGDALSYLSAVLDVNRNAVAAVDVAGEHVLEEALAVVARGAIPTPAAGGGQDDRQRQPLSRRAAAVLDLLKALPAGRAMTGREILKAFDDKQDWMDQSTLTTHIIPTLRPYGVKNKRGAGYYIDTSQGPGSAANSR